MLFGVATLSHVDLFDFGFHGGPWFLLTLTFKSLSFFSFVLQNLGGRLKVLEHNMKILIRDRLKAIL